MKAVITAVQKAVTITAIHRKANYHTALQQANQAQAQAVNQKRQLNPYLSPQKNLLLNLPQNLQTNLQINLQKNLVLLRHKTTSTFRTVILL